MKTNLEGSSLLESSKLTLLLASLTFSLELDTFTLNYFIPTSSFPRCLFGSLLHPSPHHWNPSLLPGAGRGSEDPTWEHRGLELRLSQSGWDWSIKFDGEGKMAKIYLFNVKKHLSMSVFVRVYSM